MAHQIYSLTDNLTVTMSEANPFSKIKIRSDSIVNKALTSYNLSVEGTVNAKSTDVLEVRFPKQIKV